MPDKCSDSVINQTHLDPEPIAIITLCVGTLAMEGAVANTFINLGSSFATNRIVS